MQHSLGNWQMLPFENITIVDLTSVVAGPTATQILAQQGARVWKVEPPEGDSARALGAIGARSISSVHLVLNAEKQSVGINLASEGGRDLLRQMLPFADVVIHNFRPGVPERLGIEPATLHAINPQLIVARIAGFGQEGPMSDGRAYDPIVQAEAAMLSWSSEEPLLSPQWICDKNAGLYAAQAISAALYSRAKSKDGNGSVIDISMLEAGVSYGWIDQHGDQVIVDPALPMPNIAAVYRPWQTADGWIVVVMLSQAEFEGWARALSAPELLSETQFSDMASRFLHWDAMREIAAPRLAAMTTAMAILRLKNSGVPCGIANRSEALHVHAQLCHDNFIATQQHPDAGIIRRPLPVARFNGTRSKCDTHAPRIGRDSMAVLKTCGVNDQAIAAAFASGAAFQPED